MIVLIFVNAFLLFDLQWPCAIIAKKDGDINNATLSPCLNITNITFKFAVKLKSLRKKDAPFYPGRSQTESVTTEVIKYYKEKLPDKIKNKLINFIAKEQKISRKVAADFFDKEMPETILAAFKNKEILGYFSLEINERIKEGIGHFLYVKKDMRENGIGRLLFRTALAELNKKKIVHFEGIQVAEDAVEFFNHLFPKVSGNDYNIVKIMNNDDFTQSRYIEEDVDTLTIRYILGYIIKLKKDGWLSDDNSDSLITRNIAEVLGLEKAEADLLVKLVLDTSQKSIKSHIQEYNIRFKENKRKIKELTDIFLKIDFNNYEKKEKEIINKVLGRMERLIEDHSSMFGLMDDTLDTGVSLEISLKKKFAAEIRGYMKNNQSGLWGKITEEIPIGQAI